SFARAASVEFGSESTRRAQGEVGGRRSSSLKRTPSYVPGGAPAWTPSAPPRERALRHPQEATRTRGGPVAAWRVPALKGLSVVSRELAVYHSSTRTGRNGAAPGGTARATKYPQPLKQAESRYGAESGG